MHTQFGISCELHVPVRLALPHTMESKSVLKEIVFYCRLYRIFAYRMCYVSFCLLVYGNAICLNMHTVRVMSLYMDSRRLSTAAAERECGGGGGGGGINHPTLP